ncbi:MAG TPA: glycosyltransferase family 1 protein [Candidatus Sulfotelmatobacter sp.]|nr:glycosyltransferase family 1 protein [Candidatus Sulfotelmatobacter sp.]
MTTPLHIAVDARFAVLDDRGIGRYTRAVAARLRDDPALAWTFVAPGPFAPRARIAAALSVPRAQVVGRVPRDAAVVWNPSNATDLAAAAPQVTMVHDLVPFAFPAADARVRAREQDPLRRTARRAQRILVNSAFTAAELTTYLGVAPERITVTPLGIEPAFAAGGPRHRLADGRPYVLHVGAHDPRKNLPTLVAAWRRAFPDASVALAFTRAPRDRIAGSVTVAPADDAALAALYRGAALVAVPSLHEGFGLPVLEAMACGAPVLASRVAALPEVGRDAVAWIDEPLDVAVWASALCTALYDAAVTRARAERGPALAAGYTWERCATLTLTALRDAALSPERYPTSG